MNSRVGQQLGNYRLMRLLGQGAFAEVYLGEHIHLNTLAAVKILNTQLISSDLEHFRTEARIIARLEHPNIVKVFDFGVDGQTPFLVMIYAPNGTLRQQFPKGVQIPINTIISYTKQVADALQYAHNEHLIHRDIKPENMLLGRQNEVLLSDFGIALMTQTSRYQNTQDVVGTIAYMAPEQLQGKPRPASDQYALGIIVYEWLTGDRPFHGSFTEMYSQHMFVPPPSIREKIPDFPPTVEEVLKTALAKDPQQRFPTIHAFAVALEKASLPSWSSGGFGVPDNSPTLLIRSENPRSQPAYPATEPTQFSQYPQYPVTAGETRPTRRRVSRRLVLIGLGGLAVGAGLSWLVLSQKLSSPNSASQHGSTLPSQATPTHASSTPASSPVSAIGTLVYTYNGHSSPVGTVGWSSNGRRIASGSRNIEIWDAFSGANVLTYSGHQGDVQSLVWSTDGSEIASGSNDQTVKEWDAATGATRINFQGHTGIVWAVAWSADSKYIASGSDDTRVGVWNANSGGNIIFYSGHKDVVYAVAFSPDSQRIASGSFDKTVQVWDTTTGQRVVTYTLHTGHIHAIAWSGSLIASASSDQTVQIWNANTGVMSQKYTGHFDAVNAVAWSPDGTRIASGSADTTVQIWDPLTGNLIYKYRGHQGAVNALVWSPDSKFIASASVDKTVQVWHAR